MPSITEELDLLRELKKDYQLLQHKEKYAQTLEEQKKSLQNSVHSAGNNAPILRTDHFAEKKHELDIRITADAKAAHSRKYWFLFCSILILGIVMMAVILLSPSEDLTLLGEGSSEVIPIFSLLFVGGMMLWGSKCIFAPFLDMDSFLLNICIYFFILCVVNIAPVMGFVVSLILLFTVSPILILLPIAIVVFMVIMVFHRRSEPTLRGYTNQETEELQNAEALDKANMEANAAASEAARSKASASANHQLSNIDHNIATLQKEIRDLKTKIDHNGILHPDDIPYVDRILWYLEHKRANSVTEALREVDKEREERHRISMETYNRRLDQIDKELNDSLNALHEEAQQAVADRRQKELEDKLDEIYKDYQYRQRYGWDRP